MLYYEKGKGVIAVGEITSPTSLSDGEEQYQTVSMIVQPNNCKFLKPGELKTLMGKGFYFASTIKVPYLSEDEVNMVIKELKFRQK